MFRPLGLLDHLPCPEQAAGRCGAQRSACPFSHDSSNLEEDKGEGSSSLKPASSPRPSDLLSPTASSPPSKRLKVNAHQGTASIASAAPIGNDSANETPDHGWTTVPPRKVPIQSAATTFDESRASSASSPPSARDTAVSGTTFRRPPVIASSNHPRSSQISLSSRNTSLKTLWNIFTTAYEPLLRSERVEVQEAGRRAAFENTLAQEVDVFSKASKTSYRTSIVTAATGVRKRNSEALRRAAKLAAELGGSSKDALRFLRESCSEVGTNSQVHAKREAIEVREKTRLIPSKLREHHFLCPPTKLAEYGYVVTPQDESIEDAWGPGGSVPHAIGEKKDCSRCGKEFIVGGELDEDGHRRGQDERACHYHWGKKRFDRDSGAEGRAKIQFWTCCSRPVESGHMAPSLSVLAGFGGPSTSVEGDETCANGPHVFKEDKVEDLHKREGFVSTDELAQSMAGEEAVGYLAIAAIDCELGYTTAGMSMTRVTVLDESGAVVLDELVRPRADIIDANLRFSGVTKEQIEQPGTKSLAEVRKEIARFVGPDTIIIGHGLENDLNAMRLLHTTLVDTALLFPHHKGLPFRHGLKLLSSKHLQRSIQDGPATAGHSSIEDAKASLDLVKWKMVNDRRTPFCPDPASTHGGLSQKVDVTSSPQAVVGVETRNEGVVIGTLAKRSMPHNPFSRPTAHSPPPPTDALAGLFIPKRR